MTVKNKYRCICSKCGKEYFIECTQKEFEKGKYRKTCSSSCANSRPMTETRRQKISDGVKSHNKLNTKQSKIYTYICETCNKQFETTRAFRKERHIKCPECIQKRKHYQENPQSILDLSKRTISKIINRSNIGCVLCGWNDSTCDIHHIIERKNGGSDDLTNLIIVCPNCHRVIHSNKKYTVDELQKFSIDKHFSNWKDFYHPSN